MLIYRLSERRYFKQKDKASQFHSNFYVYITHTKEMQLRCTRVTLCNVHVLLRSIHIITRVQQFEHIVVAITVMIAPQLINVLYF